MDLSILASEDLLMQTESKAVAIRGGRRGVTLIEMLAVIGVLVILMAILLPSLATVRGNAVLMKSYNSLRQIATFSEAYAKDNRETVVPSAFDYSTAPTPGKVRSNRKPDGSEPPPPAGMLRKGTWADILWTTSGLGPASTGGNYGWEFDAPDGYLYALEPDFDRNPFRASQPMTKVFEEDMSADASINANELGSRALPEHVGQPGMFAMNNFFDSRTGNWYATSQVRHASRSLMLVDSYAGETIDPVDPPSGVQPWRGSDPLKCQVDFRYIGGVAALLFFDGHTEAQPRWDDLIDLQGDVDDENDNGRGVRVTDLDKPSKSS